MTMRSEVLRCYKALNRARLNVFRGDKHMLQNSLEAMKSEFRKNAGEKDPQKIQKLLEEGWEVEKFLRTSLVQGVLNERGNYEISLPKDFPANTSLEPITK